MNSNIQTRPVIETQGLHHLGLTVPDIEATAAFFTEVLGYEVVGENPDYPAVFVSDGVTMLTLWQTTNSETCTKFDRKQNIGLHHFAIKLADEQQLTALHSYLLEHKKAEIEFAPEPLGASTLRHMMCYIPGGIRVEFIVATQA